MSAKIVPLFGDLPQAEKPKRAKREKAPEPYAGVTTSPHFERAWAAFPKQGRVRSSKTQAFPEWKKIAPKVGKDALVAAVERYAREDKDQHRDGGPPGFHRWLKWGRWENWLPEAEGEVDPAMPRFPDAEVRARLVAVFGESFVMSWFDKSTLCGSEVRTTSGIAFGKMSEAVVREALAGLGLTAALVSR